MCRVGPEPGVGDCTRGVAMPPMLARLALMLCGGLCAALGEEEDWEEESEFVMLGLIGDVDEVGEVGEVGEGEDVGEGGEGVEPRRPRVVLDWR